MLRAAARGEPTAPTRRRAAPTGVLATAPTPRAASSAPEGVGLGIHACSALIGSGTGLTSNSTVAMSTPATPSTSEWWVFEISAKRRLRSPSTSQSSQSGFVWSSCWEKTRAAIRRSVVSSPGEGRAEWRTW